MKPSPEPRPIGLADLHRLVRMHQVRVGGSLLAAVGVIVFIAVDGVPSIAGIVVALVALAGVAWAMVGISRQRRVLLGPSRPVSAPASVTELDAARSTIRRLSVAALIGYGLLTLAFLTVI